MLQVDELSHLFGNRSSQLVRAQVSTIWWAVVGDWNESLNELTSSSERSNRTVPSELILPVDCPIKFCEMEWVKNQENKMWHPYRCSRWMSCPISLGIVPVSWFEFRFLQSGEQRLVIGMRELTILSNWWGGPSERESIRSICSEINLWFVNRPRTIIQFLFTQFVKIHGHSHGSQRHQITNLGRNASAQFLITPGPDPQSEWYVMCTTKKNSEVSQSFGRLGTIGKVLLEKNFQRWHSNPRSKRIASWFWPSVTTNSNLWSHII